MSVAAVTTVVEVAVVTSSSSSLWQVGQMPESHEIPRHFDKVYYLLLLRGKWQCKK